LNAPIPAASSKNHNPFTDVSSAMVNRPLLTEISKFIEEGIDRAMRREVVRAAFPAAPVVAATSDVARFETLCEAASVVTARSGLRQARTCARGL